MGSRKSRRYFTARRTRTICCGQRVLPFPASGNPSAKQRSARAPKGELPRLYNRGRLKIGARDEQRVSANSTHALFARWEMSKRKNKAFAVPARGGVADDALQRFPLGSRKSRRNFSARRARRWLPKTHGNCRARPERQFRELTPDLPYNSIPAARRNGNRRRTRGTLRQPFGRAPRHPPPSRPRRNRG